MTSKHKSVLVSSLIQKFSHIYKKFEMRSPHLRITNGVKACGQLSSPLRIGG